MKKVELPYADNILKEKEYHNHFYIPGPVVFLYIVHECTILDIPITSKEIQETKDDFKNWIKQNGGKI